MAPESQLRSRTYNVTAMSFSPEELVRAVREHVPNLEVSYRPDSRQQIGTHTSAGRLMEGCGAPGALCWLCNVYVL